MSGLIQRKKVAIGKASVTVRTSSAWALTDADTIRHRLILALGKMFEENGETFARVDDIQASRLGIFILLLLNTEKVDGSLGFAWPLPSASTDDLVKAFGQVGECLTATQLNEWVDAIKEVDAPPGPPELAPGADPEASSPKT